MMTINNSQSRRAFLIRSFQLLGYGSIASTNLMGAMVQAASNENCQLNDFLPLGQSIYKFGDACVVDGVKVTDENYADIVCTGNSIIEVGESSALIFRVGDAAHFVRENTRLELEGTKTVEKTLRIISGKVLSVFGKRDKDNQVTLHTSTATMGIRGTGIYAHSELSKNRSYVCTCYGKVNIQAKKDPSVSVELETTHHDDPKYIYADESYGELIQPGPFKDHSDEELQLIEALVCRTTPFGSTKEAYPRRRRNY